MPCLTVYIPNAEYLLLQRFAKQSRRPPGKLLNEIVVEALTAPESLSDLQLEPSELQERIRDVLGLLGNATLDEIAQRLNHFHHGRLFLALHALVARGEAVLDPIEGKTPRNYLWLSPTVAHAPVAAVGS